MPDQKVMKILFFINGIHSGGKERRMLELMKELKLRKQFEFELVVMSSEINYPEVFDLGIKIHYLLRKIKKDPGIFSRFYKICKTYKPDIVHCWDSMTAVYSIFVCKLLHIKMINGMVVDVPVKKNLLNKDWLRAQLTFPFSNIIIGNSKAGLSAYKAPTIKSLCIYNGMNLARFNDLEEPVSIRKGIFGDDSNDIFIVGMVAAFEARKDYKTLIEAAIALIPNHDNLRFVLVGGGPDLNKLKDNIPISLKEKIIFLGKKTNVEPIINIFDVGVLLTNSKVHGEGISNSIIEYMALGKPVIATRGGGTNELVFDSLNGILIDAGNKEQLIEKVEVLIKDKNKGSLGKKGYQMVQEKFDIKTMTNHYTVVYQKLLKKTEKQ